MTVLSPLVRLHQQVKQQSSQKRRAHCDPTRYLPFVKCVGKRGQPPVYHFQLLVDSGRPPLLARLKLDELLKVLEKKWYLMIGQD